MCKIPCMLTIQFRLMSRQLSVTEVFLAFFSSICSTFPTPLKNIQPLCPVLAELGVPRCRPRPIHFCLCLQPPLQLPMVSVYPTPFKISSLSSSQFSSEVSFSCLPPSITSPIKPFCDQLSTQMSPPLQTFSLSLPPRPPYFSSSFL